MLLEQEFIYQKKPCEIFNSLNIQKEEPTEIEKDILMLYIGSKNNEFISQVNNILKDNDISNNQNINFIQEQAGENEENKKNNLFLVKYKNIYIGGISINLKMREGFGLNKYENSSSFYLGQWKNNMKEGTGFLKIDDNKLYIGSFHHNQFEGFGIIYYKLNDTFYFGEFKNGVFSQGIYCNINKELYYRGKFHQNKKNDSFCTFLEKNIKHLFIVYINHQIFVKRDIFLCLIHI